MSRLLDRHPWLLFPVLILAFGIAGSMDYADAKLAEKTMCERYPNKPWCGEEIK
jgi:hypothetical protein